MTLRPRSPPPSPLRVWLLRGPFVTSLVSLRVLPSTLSSSPREKKTRLSFHPGPDSSQISVCGPVSPGPGYPVALQMCPLGYLPGSSSTSVCPAWVPRLPSACVLAWASFLRNVVVTCSSSPTPAPCPSLYPPRASETDLAVPASVTSLEFGVLSLSPGRLDSGHFADSLSLTAPRTPRVPTGDTRTPHLTDTPLLPLPALFSSTALMTFQPVILLTSLYYLYISFMFIMLMMFVVFPPFHISSRWAGISRSFLCSGAFPLPETGAGT